MWLHAPSLGTVENTTECFMNKVTPRNCSWGAARLLLRTRVEIVLFQPASYQVVSASENAARKYYRLIQFGEVRTRLGAKAVKP
jgi:hypothetical protein